MQTLMENERGQIEVLEQTRKEIDEKVKRLNELRQEQINILQDKLKDHSGIMKWYIQQLLNFTHPDFNFVNPKGPILGYIKNKDEVIVYDVQNEKLIAQLLGTTEIRRSSFREIVDTGNFENAIKGFDYLLTMQNDHLKNIDKDIERLEEEIKRVKK